MEAVREREVMQTTNTDLEVQRHNAQIRERYRKLQSAEADQFASDVQVENVATETRKEELAPSAYAYSAPVMDTPAMEQTPEVTDFVREQVASSVFTADKFDAIQEVKEEVASATFVTPVLEVAPVAAAVAEERYALSAFAKVVMAIFTLVVVAMMTLIGVNSQVISNQRIKLKNLEEKREQLIEQHDEIQSRIAAAQSEETIRQWAESQGLAQAGN